MSEITFGIGASSTDDQKGYPNVLYYAAVHVVADAPPVVMKYTHFSAV